MGQMEENEAGRWIEMMFSKSQQLSLRIHLGRRPGPLVTTSHSSLCGLFQSHKTITVLITSHFCLWGAQLGDVQERELNDCISPLLALLQLSVPVSRNTWDFLSGPFDMACLTKVDWLKKHNGCTNCLVFLYSTIKFKRYNTLIKHSVPDTSDYFMMLNFFYCCSENPVSLLF